MAVASAREGRATERDRLGELYRRHAREAGRLAYLLTGDRALAEDVVRDAFVRLLGRFADLRNPDAFAWYLRRTVVNLVRSHFRHRRVEVAYVERHGHLSGDDALPDLEGRDELWRRLSALRERERAALVLRFYEDLTEAQTADVMGCPVGTVKSLVSRGLDRLRRDLDQGR